LPSARPLSPAPSYATFSLLFQVHQGFAFGSFTRGPFVRHLFTLILGSSRLCLRLVHPRPLRTPPVHPQVHRGFAFGSSTRGPFVRHLFTRRFIKALPSARRPAAPSYATFSPSGSSRLCLRLIPGYTHSHLRLTHSHLRHSPISPIHFSTFPKPHHDNRQPHPEF